MFGSQRKFAEYIGKSKSMVAKLAKEGKLVLVNGQIDFEASKKKIELLQNVSNRGGNNSNKINIKPTITSKQKDIKQDVIDNISSVSDISPLSTDYPEQLDNIVKIKQVYDAGKAKAAHYEGETKKLEFLKKAGELADITIIQRVAFDLAKTLRNSISPIALRVAPKIAGITDPKKQTEIQILINDEIESVLNEFTKEIEKL